MKIPIIDLHCDLLLYLEQDKNRCAFDLSPHCAIPQLREGNVQIQVLAVFTETGPNSTRSGWHQAQIFRDLPINYPNDFIHFSPYWNQESSQIAVAIAIENASAFFEEKEPLQEGFKRLEKLIKEIAKPQYISLTWNTENRFGGGALTSIGLKDDGKRFLERLDKQNIAMDLSHASDALAYEIIDYIEGKGLLIPIIASHSNSREIKDVPRNLPDDIAKEIFRRKGVIGLNLYSHFVGDSEEDLMDHIAHWLELGGEEAVALGTDFFYEEDLPLIHRKSGPTFYTNFQDSSCFGRLMSWIQKELKLNSLQIEKLAYRNALEHLFRTPS